MRFFYDNMIDGVNVVLTASSEDAEYPVENIQNQFIGKPWKSEDSNAHEYIIGDFGEAKEVQAGILFAHDLKAGDTVKFQLNDSTDFSSPAVDETMTHDEDAMVVVLDTPETYRYWRIDIIKDNAAETREIGRVFIGPLMEARDPDYDGYKVEDHDLSRVSESVSKQRYSTVNGTYRTFMLKVSGVGTTEKDYYQALAREVGVHTAFFCQVTDDGEFTEYLYVYFNKLSGYNVEGKDSE